MKRVGLVLLAMAVPLMMGAGSESSSSASSAKHEQYYNKGVKAQEKGDYDEAVKWYRRALSEKADYADALNNLGFSLRSIGKKYMDEAERAYVSALKIDANHEQALEYQGELFLWRGKLSEANRNLEQLKRLKSREAAELQQKLDAVLGEAKKVL